MNGLRELMALLPAVPDDEVCMSPHVVEGLQSACDRFDAEWRRLFGECPRPIDPNSDDEIDTNAPASAPRQETGE